MDNRTLSGDRHEKRANSPELRLPEPKQGVAKEQIEEVGVSYR